jgi:hypothetical protein
VTSTAWMDPGPQGDWSPVDLQTDRPHPARVYDYLLGGKDHFAADRAAGEEALRVKPEAKASPRENRAFLHRVIRHLAGEAGIRQFLDIGTGLPTPPNVHEVAQGIVPEARIVYADNDPIVLAHARALLTSSHPGRTAYIDADLRDPDSILSAAALRELLDFDQPVAVLLVAIMHFITDQDGPYEIVGRLLEALPVGSYLAMSHVTGDFDPQAWAEVTAVYARNGMALKVRSKSEIERFFTGLDLVEPGVISVPRWRRDPGDGQQGPSSDSAVSAYGALARKS